MSVTLSSTFHKRSAAFPVRGGDRSPGPCFGVGDVHRRRPSTLRIIEFADATQNCTSVVDMCVWRSLFTNRACSECQSLHNSLEGGWELGGLAWAFHNRRGIHTGSYTVNALSSIARWWWVVGRCVRRAGVAQGGSLDKFFILSATSCTLTTAFYNFIS